MCRFPTTAVREKEKDGYDPQVFAAMQTRFIVDVQEGTSMIFFLNRKNLKLIRIRESFRQMKETM